MLFKNVAGQKCIVAAYDTITESWQTGDAANITANISKDGAAGVASNDVNPTEIGGGLYAFDLTQAETNCDLFALYATSTTDGVEIEPIVWPTQGGAIPKAAPGGAGGLALHDTVAAIQAKTALIVAGGITIRSPVIGGRHIMLVRARAHPAAEGLAIVFEDTAGDWSDYSGAAIALRICNRADGAEVVSIAGVYAAGPPKTITLEPTAVETADLTMGLRAYGFELVVTPPASEPFTRAWGDVTVSPHWP